MTHAIPVFFACNDAYVPHLCVTIVSILENSDAPFSFHVLNQDISEESQNQVLKLGSLRPFDIEFIHVNRGMFGDLKIDAEHVSIETAFRFLVPQIRPEFRKAIYLDCDLVVQDDLKKLWDVEPGQNYAGVVEDLLPRKDYRSHKARIGIRRYFNAGMLLLNLEQIRQDFSVETFLSIERKNRAWFLFADQDVLNFAFANRVIYLPLRWNVVAPVFRNHRRINRDHSYTRQEIVSARNSPAIVHFVGQDKPWVVPRGITAHPCVSEYYRYLRKTPFADQEKQIMRSFPATRIFLRYWWRRPFFFFRLNFWKMWLLKQKIAANAQ
ncbi:LPS:glycosyltransferase [Opitutaceae bacterium TAV1]|nr:LPS:glycosyltransferase [Opitutaceae bacterium TAV1]